jgi:hypothetical protein
MLRAGFEPEISMFERPKTARALDHAAIGTYHFLNACSEASSNYILMLYKSVLSISVTI